MTDRLDRLFDEVDRQLEEVREQALALATRAGLLISASGVGAAVLAARVDNVKGSFTGAFWALGIALLAAIVALAPTLTIGPAASSLGVWTSGDSRDAVTELYKAKLITLSANRLRLAVMTCAFYLEAVAVAVALVVVLVVAAGR